MPPSFLVQNKLSIATSVALLTFAPVIVRAQNPTPGTPASPPNTQPVTGRVDPSPTQPNRTEDSRTDPAAPPPNATIPTAPSQATRSNIAPPTTNNTPRTTDLPPRPQSTLTAPATDGTAPNTAPGTTAPNTARPPTAGPEESTFSVPDAPPVIAGQEAPGGNYSLESPNLIEDRNKGIAVARGDLIFRYRELEVRGRRGVIDYNTNMATLSDNLTVTARVGNATRVFKGQSLQFNLDSGAWTLGQIRATFPPDTFPPGSVLEPLFIRNGQVTGSNEDATGSDFDFTTCERGHYHLRSGRLDFARDANGRPRRIALKRNALYVFGNKILPLPNYVIGLQAERSRRYGLQPTVGQNSFDGFFVKTLYDLAATNTRSDSLLIDVLQKRGLGLGLQRELASGAGLFYLYALSGKQGGRQIDSRIRRDFAISQALRASLNFDSTQNNSIAGQGFASQNGQANFNFGTARVQSNLLLSQNASDSPFSSFSQQNATFSHRHNLGSAWDIELDSAYARTQTSGSDEVATLDNLFGLNRRGSRFDAFLRAELHDDLTGRSQVNGAYQLERLPELQLSTDTQRLGLPFFERALPGELNLSIAQFNEPSSAQKLARTDFNYILRDREFSLLERGFLRSQLNVGGHFGQAFYGDDTARYNYNYNFSLNNYVGRQRRGRTPAASTAVDDEGNAGPGFGQLPGGFGAGGRGDSGGALLNFQLNYFKLRTVGFTPFQFDFLSPNEFIDARAIFEPSRKLRLELSGGRDLQNGVTRDLTSTLRIAPSPSLNFDLSTSYSPEDRRLGDVIGNIYLSRRRESFLGGSAVLAFRYSPDQSTFTAINAAGDISLGRKTRLQFFTGYNGFTGQFDFQQFRIAQDLHCFNLFATFDSQRKELRFDLALKAFPFLDTRLGQNQLGESFDPQIGAVR